MNQDTRVAFVTGGARGIGWATCEELVAHGWRVAIGDLDGDAARARTDEGRGILGLPLDVADGASIDAALDATLERFGRLDLLVNNAGIQRHGPIEELAFADWRAVLDVNLDGVFRCLQAGGRRMLAAGRGAIVNMSSSSALMGNNAVGAYGATKWAVRGLTRSAALEYGPHGVRVNGVHPYGIDTWMSNPQGAPRETLNPGYRNVPLQRMGDPSEVANAVLYLASDAASYTSGAELAVDGATCAGQYFYGLPGAPY